MRQERWQRDNEENILYGHSLKYTKLISFFFHSRYLFSIVRSQYLQAFEYRTPKKINGRSLFLNKLVYLPSMYDLMNYCCSVCLNWTEVAFIYIRWLDYYTTVQGIIFFPSHIYLFLLLFFFIAFFLAPIYNNHAEHKYNEEKTEWTDVYSETDEQWWWWWFTSFFTRLISCGIFSFYLKVNRLLWYTDRRHVWEKHLLNVQVYSSSNYYPRSYS